MKTESNRVLLVGLDGATFSVLRPLAEAGRLPNLSAMLARGAHGVLRSTIPPITPTAWTSIFTGKNPDKHGLFDFQTIDSKTYERSIVRTGQHEEKLLWEILSDADIASTVIDVPFTWPPRPFKGQMITGYGTPRVDGTVITFPSDLTQQLPASLQSAVHVALPQNDFDRSDAFLSEWQAVMDEREKLLEWFAMQKDWRFFFTVFSITDNLAHLLWTFLEPAHPNYEHADAPKFREAFYGAYIRCDKILGHLMEWGGENCNTLVISDHGFGSIRPRQYLFQLLVEGGFVVPKQGTALARLTGGFQKAAVGIYNAHPSIREFVKGLRPGYREQLKRALKRSGMAVDGDEFDLEKSMVIPSPFGLQLWINANDRFPKGVVSSKEKNDVLEQLVTYLNSARDSNTGQAIFKEVHRGDTVFNKRKHLNAPDVIVEYADCFPAAGQEVSKQNKNPSLEGGHTPDGILLGYGPAFHEARLQGAQLENLAPTILHLLGEPIPMDFDGRVLTDMMNKQYMTEHPIRVGTTAATKTPADKNGYTQQEEAEVLKQLEDLGYV